MENFVNVLIVVGFVCVLFGAYVLAKKTFTKKEGEDAKDIMNNVMEEMYSFVNSVLTMSDVLIVFTAEAIIGSNLSPEDYSIEDVIEDVLDKLMEHLILNSLKYLEANVLIDRLGKDVVKNGIRIVVTNLINKYSDDVVKTVTDLQDKLS